MVALRVAGDADLVEAVAALAHRGEQVRRAVERPRLLGVAGGHEQLADARGMEAVEDLVQMRPVADEAGGEVRDDGVAGVGEALGERERRLQALARRRGDRDAGVRAQVGEDLLLDPVEREHLEARAAQEGGERRADAERRGGRHAPSGKRSTS